MSGNFGGSGQNGEIGTWQPEGSEATTADHDNRYFIYLIFFKGWGG